MTLHGNVSFWRAFQWPQARKSASTGEPDPARGFRHFIETPAPHQQFRLDNIPFDPSNDEMWKRANELMQKLATAMWGTPIPQGEECGLEKELNPCLPSGYTYFLQLVAHDFVNSAIVLSRNGGQLEGLANNRHLPLRLETIYGGGSLACPHAYQKDEDSDFQNRLRLGRIREDEQDYQNNYGPERDIARARATEVLSKQEYPEPLIGDARNDSHAIISQMVMVAHHVHNAVLEWLKSNGSIEPTGSKFTDAQRAFIAAQSTCVMIYRYLIQEYLLPKILHPDVWDAYRLNRVPVLDLDNGLASGIWRAPYEFTFGFFRFGHSMIRRGYRFNSGFDASLGDILNHTSEQRPHRMPFERKWTIDWRYFFSQEIYTGNPPKKNNFSVRIGPWGKQPSSGNVGGPNSEKLVYRDLISSIATRPWSMEALVRRLWPTHGKLLARSTLFKRECHRDGERPWAKIIGAWLRERAKANRGLGLSDADIKTLSDDPPIPFFVRYEASHEAEGKHLGILGSIVVADVFEAVFRQDKVMGIEAVGGLETQLTALGRLLFDDNNVLVQWSDVKTFAGLFTSLGMTFPAIHEPN